MAESSTGARVLSAVLAMLFALFTVSSVTRVGDAWAAGARGQLVLSLLAAIGGGSLVVDSLRRALRQRR